MRGFGVVLGKVLVYLKLMCEGKDWVLRIDVGKFFV